MPNEQLPGRILEQVYRFAKMAQRSRFSQDGQALRKFTINEFTLMMALCQGEDEQRPVTMSDASRILGISRPAVTQLVLRLCKGGYVERVRDTRDRRIMFLRLTQKARDAATAEYAKQIRFTERFVKAYGAERSEQFLGMLADIYEVYKTILTEEEEK